MTAGEQEPLFQVVVNLEAQYSCWPLERNLPAGWMAEGFSGTREACTRHIATVWTDMRPLSLRQFMAAQSGNCAAESASGARSDGSVQQQSHPVGGTVR